MPPQNPIRCQAARTWPGSFGPTGGLPARGLWEHRDPQGIGGASRFSVRSDRAEPVPGTPCCRWLVISARPSGTGSAWRLGTAAAVARRVVTAASSSVRAVDPGR